MDIRGVSRSSTTPSAATSPRTVRASSSPEEGKPSPLPWSSSSSGSSDGAVKDVERLLMIDEATGAPVGVESPGTEGSSDAGSIERREDGKAVRKRARGIAAEEPVGSMRPLNILKLPVRAASEPPPATNHKLSPSPPIMSPARDEMTPPMTPDASILTIVGGLPLETFLHIVELLHESDLIRISHTSRAFRRAVIACPRLWRRSLTLDLATPHLKHKLCTWLERAASEGISSLRLRLCQPNVLFDPRTNKQIWDPQDRYFAEKPLIGLNLGLIGDVMESKAADIPLPSNLECYFMGMHDQTFWAVESAASWITNSSWVENLKSFKLSSSIPSCRLGNVLFVWLAHRTPILEILDLQFGMWGDQRSPFVFGPQRPTEMWITPEGQELMQTPSGIRTLMLQSCILPSTMLLPVLFPLLTRFEMRTCSWGRMTFEMLKRTPRLVMLRLMEFAMAQEEPETLPTDRPDEWEMDEDLSDTTSDYGQLIFKPPNINLPKLLELYIHGEQTPHIWSILGDTVSNPMIHMPNLRLLSCVRVDLEMEEQALADLTDLAPRLRDLRMINCQLNEGDVYESIKYMADIESLDFRETDGVDTELISNLALATPHLRKLDVRGCRRVNVCTVAMLAQTIRDRSGGLRRLELIGVDKPPGRLESTDLVKSWIRLGLVGPGRLGSGWSLPSNVLLDEEEWNMARQCYKDKEPIRPVWHPPLEKIKLKVSKTDSKDAKAAVAGAGGSAGSGARTGDGSGTAVTAPKMVMLQPIRLERTSTGNWEQMETSENAELLADATYDDEEATPDTPFAEDEDVAMSDAGSAFESEATDIVHAAEVAAEVADAVMDEEQGALEAQKEAIRSEAERMAGAAGAGRDPVLVVE